MAATHRAAFVSGSPTWTPFNLQFTLPIHPCDDIAVSYSTWNFSIETASFIIIVRNIKFWSYLAPICYNRHPCTAAHQHCKYTRKEEKLVDHINWSRCLIPLGLGILYLFQMMTSFVVANCWTYAVLTRSGLSSSSFRYFVYIKHGSKRIPRMILLPRGHAEVLFHGGIALWLRAGLNPGNITSFAVCGCCG